MTKPIKLNLTEFLGTRDMLLAADIKPDAGYVWMLPVNPVSAKKLSAVVDLFYLRHWCVEVLAAIDEVDPQLRASAEFVAAEPGTPESAAALERFIAAIPECELAEL